MSVLPLSKSALKRILIVDDIEENRDLLDRALRNSGYETVTASSGRDALSIVSTMVPDLVLLDWMMPQLSGLDTLRAIRELYPRSVLPVIMCTAVGEEMSVVAAIAAGANDYITKPISIPILRARMAALFDQMAVISALDARKSAAELRLLERTRSMLGSAGDGKSADGRP
jgi:Response regulators consisting of a CheY-like receiver domain and a winged-helix DNA-binding domain